MDTILKLLLRMNERYGAVKLVVDGKNKYNEPIYRLYFGDDFLIGTKKVLNKELIKMTKELNL